MKIRANVFRSIAANLTLVSSANPEDFGTAGEDDPEQDPTGRADHTAHHPNATGPEAPRPTMRFGDADLPPTLEVHRLPPFDLPPRPADTSNLVRSHRESAGRSEQPSRATAEDRSRPRVFDFEAEENDDSGR